MYYTNQNMPDMKYEIWNENISNMKYEIGVWVIRIMEYGCSWAPFPVHEWIALKYQWNVYNVIFCTWLVLSFRGWWMPYETAWKICMSIWQISNPIPHDRNPKVHFGAKVIVVSVRSHLRQQQDTIHGNNIRTHGDCMHSMHACLPRICYYIKKVCAKKKYVQFCSMCTWGRVPSGSITLQSVPLLIPIQLTET